mmetsp:Transcript_31705/g.79201  ORF Transcript_31705/g.79201 Transcript_31705/m.79201 type:complete len:452 (+) Transcript_31705:91-1446(+)
MRFRRMQLLLFAVSFAAGAVFMFTLGVLDGTLRERRRHAGELDAHAAGQDEQLGLDSTRVASESPRQRPAQIRNSADSPPQPADSPSATATEPAATSVPTVVRGSPPTPHAVVIFAYNRPAYLERSLRSVLGRLPMDGSHTLAVSQDGDDAGVAAIVEKEGGGKILHLRHPRIQIVLGNKQKHLMGYYCLAQHYKWALDELINRMGFESVIILEDDIEVAPDFFEYFRTMAPLLDNDPSLLTVSAYSDNGQSQHVYDPSAVYRSDFFPGLGWLMTTKLWAELGPKWPLSFWDDWLREPANRRGRASIRPEISRTYTFGVKKGVSSGQFSIFLKSTQLAQVKVDWQAINVQWLDQRQYDLIFANQLGAALEVEPHKIPVQSKDCGDLRISYSSPKEFERLAKQLGLMTDLKAGVPRTGYLGVVTFRRGACRIFLAPTYAVDSETQSIVIEYS